MNEKWIKIHNKFLNWEWYTDVNTKAVFIHCILKANWRDCSYQGIVVPRGSFVTGRKKLVKELGQSTTINNSIWLSNLINSRFG